jgi:hypothetical protein
MHQGRCECGAIRFTITAPLKQPTACHCSQCRRVSGHVWAGTSVDHADLRFDSDAGLTWFRSSDHAERGFCSKCGSSLFYRPIDGDHVSVAAGSLDQPTGVKLRRHIFVADKGDYYDIADGLPQIDTR